VTDDPVQRQVDAYNRRDLDAFLDCYAPETEVGDAAGGTLMRGSDAMRAAYGELFRESPSLQVEISTRIRIGEYVIDEEIVTGRRGSAEEVRVVVVYHVTEGLIDQVRMIR
jgi:hypothetical protein